MSRTPGRLGVVLLFAVVSLCSLAPASLATTLAYYPFENSYADAGGNGHTLAVSGAVSFVADNASGRPGASSVAISPAAVSNSYLLANLLVDTDVTIELYFKASADGFLASNFWYNGSNQPTGWGLRVIGGNVGLSLASAPSFTTFTTSGHDYRDGAWHHVAAYVDTAPRTATLWVDGVEIGTYPDSAFRLGAGAALRLGAVANGTSSFTGRLDEVRISTGKLTPAPMLNGTVPEPQPAWLLGALAMPVLRRRTRRRA